MATATTTSNPNTAFRTVTVGEIARLLEASFVGDGSTLITGVAGLDSALPGTISFLDNEKLFAEAIQSSAAAIIVPEALAEAVEGALRAADGFLDELQRATRTPVPHVEATLERLSEAWGLSDEAQQAAKAALQREMPDQQETLYGVVNAFTCLLYTSDAADE